MTAVVATEEVRTVLIVEDDERMRNTLIDGVNRSSQLALAGAARELAEASSLIASLSFDVLLLDLDLEGLSSRSLIAAAARRDALVLIVSILGDEQTVLGALREGAHGYLLKGDGVIDVEDAIERASANEPPLSPQIARHLLRNLRAQDDRAQDGAAPSVPHALSPREMQMLKALAAGYTYREIGELYDLSYHTVVDYVRSLYRKLSASSRSQALMTAIRDGLITPQASPLGE